MSYEGNEIQGWMNTAELRCLYHKAKEMDSVVEIGCWKGRSSHALLSGCKGTVYCVDHFKGSIGERDNSHKEASEKDISKDFMDNVGSFKNLVLYNMDSVVASKMFEDKSVDMVFLDGSHDEDSFEADLNAWIPKCKKVLMGHDYDTIKNVLFRHFQYVPELEHSIWAVTL